MRGVKYIMIGKGRVINQYLWLRIVVEFAGSEA